jgi:hypothetical protein
MMDPRRLIDDGVDEFERSLLAAGRHDSLPASNRARILGSLGLGLLAPGTAIAATTKAAVKGTMFGFAWGTGTKVAIGGTFGALAVWSSVSLWNGSGNGQPEQPSVIPAKVIIAQEASQPKPAPAERPAPEVAAEQELDEAALDETPTKAPTSPRGGPTSAKDLGKELASLEEARAALRSGEPERTLSLLDEHTRKFPRQSLRVEARVLRIEALSASGRTDSARKAGNDFLAKHPNGPYAQRVRSLIGLDKVKEE